MILTYVCGPVWCGAAMKVAGEFRGHLRHTDFLDTEVG
jgi:hypothetical protein